MEPEKITPKKNHTKLLLIIPILIILALSISLFLFQEQLFPLDEDEENNLPKVTLEKPSKDCEGGFYDSHTHLDNSGFAGQLALRMSENKVGCSIIFVSMNPDDLEESAIDFEEEFENLPGRFVPFFHVNPQKPSDVERSRLENVLNKYPDYFKGFGETAFYREPWIGSSLNTPNWDGVFELAAERNIFVMIHLRGDQMEELSSMLKKHPNTKVLVHGPESQLSENLPTLLKENSNLYFTLDTATLLNLSGFPPEILMYPQSMQKGSFVQKVDVNKTVLLQDSFNRWENVILAAPDRILWGTDASLTWHADAEVYSKLLTFSQEFIEMLPTENQKPFAYENALRLFGSGIEIK